MGIERYVELKLCGEVKCTHRITGKPIKMVPYTKVEMYVCDECSAVHTYEATYYRPAKWYNPNNIIVEHTPGPTVYLPLYS